MEVTYDFTRDPYDNRVSAVTVRCTECNIPRMVPLEDDNIYKMVVTSFIGGGGDGYGMIKDNAMNYQSGKYSTIILFLCGLFLHCIACCSRD